jgi:hypothetical protein
MLALHPCHIKYIYIYYIPSLFVLYLFSSYDVSTKNEIQLGMAILLLLTLNCKIKHNM